MVWLIGRTQTNGAADFATVHELQNRLRLTKWPQPTDSPSTSTDSKRDAKPGWQVSTEPSLPPVAQMKALSTPEFFNRLMQLMVSNPASTEEICDCLLKLLEVRGALKREAKRNATKIAESNFRELPTLPLRVSIGFLPS
jgi:hypothetical protein